MSDITFVGDSLASAVFMIVPDGSLVYHTSDGSKRKILKDGSRFYYIYEEKFDHENRPYWSVIDTVDSCASSEVEFYEVISMLFRLQPKAE